MAGPTTVSPAAFAAQLAATAAFLVSGGIWLGQLQSRIDHHTEMLAHIDAGKRLGEIEVQIGVLDTELAGMDSLLHTMAEQEEARHREIMRRLEQVGWQPYLKEE